MLKNTAALLPPANFQAVGSAYGHPDRAKTRRDAKLGNAARPILATRSALTA